MELNIVTRSEPNTGHGTAAPKNAQKGSWKARRKATLRQRPRQRAPRPSEAANRKGRTATLAHDEFASGLGAAHDSQEERKPDLNNVVGAAREKSEPSRKRPRGESEKATSSVVPARKRSAGSVAKLEMPSRKSLAATFDVVGTGELSSGSRKEAESAEQMTTTDLDEKSVKEGEPAKELKGAESDDGFFGKDFESTGLYASISRHLALRLGIERPTAIQEKMLCTVLASQEPLDVLVRSETGSGKTLAYCLPIAHFLLNRPKRVSREDGSAAIIVVPTRELAEQVEDVASRLFRPWHWIVVGSLRGGENKKHEKDRLRKGISVLVATPGRLLDHIRNTRRFTYSRCEFLVLDEADRLLDLGFEADIKECIRSIDACSQVQSEGDSLRSNFLLSATLRTDVKRLAEFSLKKPVEISALRDPKASDVDGVQGKQSRFAMPDRLRQHFSLVEQKHRLVTLGAFLRLRAMKGVAIAVPKEARSETIGALDFEDRRLPECKIIVFFSTCDAVDFHFELFQKVLRPSELDGPLDSCLGKKLVPLKLLHIHGDRAQNDRVEALREFRKSRRAVLLCTDVAARGLDLKGVSFAVQYDPPTGGHGEELEYLHRAGRTARIGERGDALLFLLPSEKQYVRKLESAGAAMQEISGNAALAALVSRAKMDNAANISYNARLATSALQEAVEKPIREQEELKALAYAGFRAYCRAYATHARELKHFFHVRNLHLGHVARAFGVIDQPGAFSEVLAVAKKAKKHVGGDRPGGKAVTSRKTEKGDIARAIAEGSTQPFNDQRTTLARRRREGGRGQEALRELASEFQS